MWNRVKKIFKKRKKKVDPVIDYTGEDQTISLSKKMVLDYDPAPSLPEGMRIHTKLIGKLPNGKQRYEVNGVILDAVDILDAQRKYLRKGKL